MIGNRVEPDVKLLEQECCTPDQTGYARLVGAGKTYKSGKDQIVALHPTDLGLTRGQLLLIVGPSGSGKTTLLSLLGCVIYPNQGCVCIGSINTKDLNDRQMAQLRLREIGFVFQNYNLIAPLNMEENVMVPLVLQKFPWVEMKERVDQALALVGLKHRKRSLPKELSGGEQQRVAVARALVSQPSLILADEPTASLDARSLEIVMNELRRLADGGKAVAVVTHDNRLKQYADTIIYLEDGRLTHREDIKRSE